MQISIWQNPTFFHDKSSQQTRNRGELPLLDKEQLQKPIVTYLVWETRCFSSTNRTRQGYSLSLLLFNIVLEVQVNEIRQESEIIYADWEGRNKIVFVCRWHDCLCRKSQAINQRTAGTVSDYNKAVGYKVNVET